MDQPSRYHLAKQDNGRGWMIVCLDAIGTGFRAKARIIECDLPESTARERLAEHRSKEKS